jgi:hypothetical protein
MQNPQLQLEARIKSLSLLVGLNCTEKTVLCRIAHRLNTGLSITEADAQCIAVMWAKHGKAVSTLNERIRKPRLRANNNG